MRRITKRKECSTCSSLISKKAKKCYQCGSYQDWRRFLDIGNMSLSLTIAFLTLMLLVFEKSEDFYKDFQARKLKVQVDRTIRNINENELVILYSNAGYTEALLPDGIVCLVPLAREESSFNNQQLFTSISIEQIKTDEVLSEFVVSYRVKGDINQLILKKEQSQLVTYEFLEVVPVTTQGPRLDEYNSYCRVSIDNVNSEPEWKSEPKTSVFNRSILGLRPLDVLLFQDYLRESDEKTTTMENE